MEDFSWLDKIAWDLWETPMCPLMRAFKILWVQQIYDDVPNDDVPNWTYDGRESARLYMDYRKSVLWPDVGKIYSVQYMV